MLVNHFIDKMLECLSQVLPRLQDTIIRLQIQTEMQNRLTFDLITYFIMLQPEYNYNWQRLNSHGTVPSIIEITSLPQFQELQLYMISAELLTVAEAAWLDDAIHEVLTSDGLSNK